MSFEPKKKLRIIVLVHEDLIPPDSLKGLSDKEAQEVKTEFDVTATLKSMGHEVHPIGLYNQLNVIGNALMEHKPHIAFNLLEEFHGYPLYDQHVVSYLELMKQAYTGCNPRGLTIAKDKALTKMILSYHRILVPSFPGVPGALSATGTAWITALPFIKRSMLTWAVAALGLGALLGMLLKACS